MPSPKIPLPSQNASIEELIDIMYRYKKELEYLLMNLDGDNVPIVNSIIEDVDGNSTSITQNVQEIQLLATDIDENTASITINSDQIASNVTDISGNKSDITQNSDQIALNVTDISGNKSDITQNADQIALNVTDISDNAASITVNADNISSLVTDVNGNSSLISQNSDEISSIVTDVDNNASEITQIANDINLRVEKNDIINQINISTESIDILASKINLDGVTTMKGLAVVNDTLKLGQSYGDGMIDMNDGVYIKNDPGASFGILFCAQSLKFDAMVSQFTGQIYLNNNDIHDVDSIYVNDLVRADRIEVNDGNGTTKTDVTSPYYAANYCYVDTDGTNVVFRDSDGNTVATI